MNDNNLYVVQCTQENFEDAKYLVQVFCQIVDIDTSNYCLRTFSLDGTMKQKLDQIGASFWQESACTLAKPVLVRRA